MPVPLSAGAEGRRGAGLPRRKDSAPGLACSPGAARFWLPMRQLGEADGLTAPLVTWGCRFVTWGCRHSTGRSKPRDRALIWSPGISLTHSIPGVSRPSCIFCGESTHVYTGWQAARGRMEGGSMTETSRHTEIPWGLLQRIAEGQADALDLVVFESLVRAVGLEEPPVEILDRARQIGRRPYPVRG